MRPLFHLVVALLVLLALVGNPWRADASALYVADAGAMAVFRYPLLPDGLPQATPASQLDLAFPPASIAFSPSGALYVSASKRGRVNVYAPLAQGHAQPIRVLETGGTPLGVATDAQGYLYVGGIGYKNVSIYAPLSHGKVSPVAVVTLLNTNYRVQQVAVDPAGRLFASSTGKYKPIADIEEFANARTAPQFVRSVSPFNGGSEKTPVAIDTNRELYAVSLGTYGGVLEFGPAATHFSDRNLQPKGAPSFTPTGVAIDARLAFVSTWSNSVSPAVYVFDVFGGSQVPLAVLGGALLVEPIAVAVGP